MVKKYESHIKFLLGIIYIYLAFRFITQWLPTLFVWLAPFILAYFVAASTQPLAKFMIKKWKIHPKVSAIISLVLNFLFLFSIVGAIIARIIIEVIRLMGNSGYIIDSIKVIVANITAYVETLEYAASINEFLGEFTSWLVTAFQWVVNSITSVAVSLPQALVFLIVFLLASIFLSLDFDNIRNAIMLQFPPKYRARVSQLKRHTIVAIFRYIRGVSILLFIDFIVLLSGFLILRVNYAFILAFMLAILDMLPIVGTAMVLIPWGLLSIISGRIPFGIGIIVTYIAMTLARQLSEPKVMSKSLDLHPFVTIMSIYIGYRVFGVIGLIVCPIATLILVSLQRSGVFRFWRTKEGQELTLDPIDDPIDS